MFLASFKLFACPCSYNLGESMVAGGFVRIVGFVQFYQKLVGWEVKNYDRKNA